MKTAQVRVLCSSPGFKSHCMHFFFAEDCIFWTTLHHKIGAEQRVDNFPVAPSSSARRFGVESEGTSKSVDCHLSFDSPPDFDSLNFGGRPASLCSGNGFPPTNIFIDGEIHRSEASERPHA